jgi:CheY-like chemotaxis protein
LTPRRLVLIADDLPEMRRDLSECFSDAGYDVLTAPDGERAFMLLCTEPVVLVVTDIVMPDVDGLELIRLARRDPFLARVPIIALRCDRAPPPNEVRAAGASVCIDKPVDAGSLVGLAARLIEDALQQSPHFGLRGDRAVTQSSKIRVREHAQGVLLTRDHDPTRGHLVARPPSGKFSRR